MDRALSASASDDAWSFALSPAERNVLEKLRSADLTRMTPLDALNELDRLQRELEE